VADSGDTTVTIDSFYDDVLKPILDSFENTIITIGQDIYNLFSQSNSMSAKEMLEKLAADVIIGFLDAIKSLALGLITIGADVIAEMRDYFNHDIDIPVIGALYKFISGGSSLTILDGLSLLIAIPTTLLYKVTTGDSPPDLTGFDIGSFFSASDPPVVADALRLFAVMGPVVYVFLAADTPLEATNTAFVAQSRKERAGAWKRSALSFAFANEQKLQSLAISSPFNLNYGPLFSLLLNVLSIPAIHPHDDWQRLRLAAWSLSTASTVSQAIGLKDSSNPETQASITKIKEALPVINGILGSVIFVIKMSITVHDYESAQDDSDFALAFFQTCISILNGVTCWCGASKNPEGQFYSRLGSAGVLGVVFIISKTSGKLVGILALTD
jgi:hypothetical protein